MFGATSCYLTKYIIFLICCLIDFDVASTSAACIDPSPNIPIEDFLDLYNVSPRKLNHLGRKTFGRTYFMTVKFGF